MQINRRTFLQMTGAAVCHTVTGNIQAAENGTEQPNIVFFLADDLGYGDLGCYGNTIIKTPVLDALASEGVKFRDCYSPGSVCSPSRCGILTGRHPNRCGIYSHIPLNSSKYLSTDEVSIARLLQTAGYATGHIGKWHLSSRLDGTEPTPGDHGFDYWFSTQNNAVPDHHNPVNFVRNGEPVGQLRGYSNTVIIDESIQYIRSVRNRSFALFVWFHSPHEVIATPQEYIDMYPEYSHDTRAQYYGNVTQMDFETGRLLEELKQLELEKNTMVIFTSDNGPSFRNPDGRSKRSHGSAGPLRGKKSQMYEGGIRVPGIIKWHGKAQPGTICHEPINGCDFFPTLCNELHIHSPVNRTIDGMDILPVFKGQTLNRTMPLYWQYNGAKFSHLKVAIRDGDWKLLADENLSRLELYNLYTDISEENNLVNRERERVQKMFAQLNELYNDINDEVKH